MHRAYSVIDVKSMDDEKRLIRGWATTPTPDRARDVIDPMGVKVAADIPLFMHHDQKLVVGRAVFGRPEKKGIPFEATLPKVVEAGSLRDRVDEAWQSVKYRLITAVSVGFLPVREKIEQLKNGGLLFPESEVIELSLVPMPMNAEAVITQFRSAHDDSSRDALIAAIKSADHAILRAAPGASRVVRLDTSLTKASPSPGVSGHQQTRRPGVVYLK